MTAPDGTNPAAEELAPETEASQTELDPAIADEAPADPAAAPEPVDDLDDLEFEGEHYRIPKVLKGGFMMQADYTRKTQEHAEAVRAFESGRQAFEAQQKFHAENLQLVAQGHAVQQRLAQLNQLDWRTLADKDPRGAQQLMFEMGQLRDMRDRIQGELQTRAQRQQIERQRESATSLEKCNQELSKSIPGWSREVAGKVRDFGLRMGIRAEELDAEANAARIKILHLAMIGDQLSRNQRSLAPNPNPAAVPAAPAAKFQTVRTVGGNSPAVGRDPTKPSSDKLPTEDWIKERNRQKHGKRKG